MVTTSEVALSARKGELGPSREIQFFVFAAVTFCFFLICKNTETVDNISLRKIVNSGEPDVISKSMLAVVRSIFATFSLFMVYCVVKEEPLVLTLSTFPDSRIKGNVEMILSGPVRFATFTQWSWMLMTVYLSGVTISSVLVLSGTVQEEGPILRWVSSLLWIMYGISVISSLLVTVIVTFVLVPEALKTNAPGIFRLMALVVHNCNVLFMATELLLNDLPLDLKHIPYVVLYGTSYIVFSWWWLRRTGMIYYSFMDPSIPMMKSLFIHIALLVTFFCVFLIMYVISSYTKEFGLVFRAIVVYGGCVYITYTPIHPWYKRAI